VCSINSADGWYPALVGNRRIKRDCTKRDASKRKTKEELKKRIRQGYRHTDPHKELYNKEYHETRFSKHICPICGSRIDENGRCACGAGDS
jgi:hypothetical protein